MGPPLRIAYVVHTFDQGGLERAIARLCSRLDRSQFIPYVVCLARSGSAASWIEPSDVQIIELGKRSGNDWRLVPRLAAALRRERIDLVQSHNWGTLVETVLARRLAGVPAHLHAERGTVLGALDLAGWRRLRVPMMRWAIRRTDGIISNAEAIARRVAEIGAPLPVPLTVIPNGVDPPKLAPTDRLHVRRALGIPDAALVVGSVGRLVAVKGFGTAIEAIQCVRDQGLDLHLILVGDGPLHAALVRQAAVRGLSDQVHFAGQQREIGSWLAAMDVFINSSQSEGMSQALLEAMSVGLPLIATDVGDSARVVGGEDAVGLVVSRGDPQALGKAIEMLLKDAEQHSIYRERALKRHATRYSVERMIDGHAQLYRAVTAGRQTRIAS